jgi:hypothetical protein
MKVTRRRVPLLPALTLIACTCLACSGDDGDGAPDGGGGPLELPKGKPWVVRLSGGHDLTAAGEKSTVLPAAQDATLVLSSQSGQVRDVRIFLGKPTGTTGAFAPRGVRMTLQDGTGYAAGDFGGAITAPGGGFSVNITTWVPVGGFSGRFEVTAGAGWIGTEKLEQPVTCEAKFDFNYSGL